MIVINLTDCSLMFKTEKMLTTFCETSVFVNTCFWCVLFRLTFQNENHEMCVLTMPLNVAAAAVLTANRTATQISHCHLQFFVHIAVFCLCCSFSQKCQHRHCHSQFNENRDVVMCGKQTLFQPWTKLAATNKIQVLAGLPLPASHLQCIGCCAGLDWVTD